MSGSNCNFGENMRKGFQALEEAVDKLKSGATKTEADAEMKKTEDRQTRDFLVAELIAAREENAGLVKRSKKVEAKVVPSGEREGDPQVGGKLPVNIFPIEVWGLMFNNLTASSDLAACSNASPDFRNELKPKRTRFLFEQVLPIIIKNGAFSPEDVFERLLELRTICRSWKAGVDNFLENHPCHQHSILSDYCTRASNIYSSPSDLTDCLQLQHFTGFSSTEDITRCLTALDELPLHALKPAIIGRTIVFTEGSWTNQNILEFWAAAQRLLTMDGIGGSIWHCSILDMSPSMLNPHLPLLLQLMPNLKTLKLLLKCAGRRVRAAQNASSLPELASLQVLKVRCCKPCLPRGYQLVSCYPHVKRLDLDFYKDERIEYSILNQPRRIGTHGVISPADREVIDEILRPNLEALCVTIHSKDEMLQVDRFAKNSAPVLTNLSLVLQSDFNDFKMVATSLENLEKPLKTLHLKLGRSLNTKKLLRLPYLEELTLETEENVVLNCVDFMLPLKSLQKLSLIKWSGDIYKDADEGDVDNVINFIGVETHLYDSNLWKLLPKLRQVLIKMEEEEEDGVWKTFAYNRAAYDKLCEVK